MFILKPDHSLKKPSPKRKKVRCSVKFRSFGNYSVKGPKDFYTVLCRKDKDGNKIVQCECKGAEKGLVCYHPVSALSLHIGIAQQRELLHKTRKA